MIEESELEGFRRDRYFARSWALLTRDRGWIKPVLVMTAAALVPFVGWLGVIGYVQEWARLTAWGVNAAPKQKGVRVGECIKSGWRAFVVILVWSLVNAAVAAVLSAVPLFGGLLGFAWTIFGIFVNLMVMVAVLRATIYQKIKAGLRVKTVWEMASHDVGGLARVLGILAVGGAILAVITFVVPFLILGLPIFDTSFAFIRRIAHGQSPMHADRGHIHHRLIDMGLNQKQAVATLYVISAILGLSAVVLTTGGEEKAMLLFAALCIVAAVAARVVFPKEVREELHEELEELREHGHHDHHHSEHPSAPEQTPGGDGKEE